MEESPFLAFQVPPDTFLLRMTSRKLMNHHRATFCKCMKEAWRRQNISGSLLGNHNWEEAFGAKKVEPYQGLTNDDTGMNGIRLHCTQGARGDKHQAHTIESQSGMWGKWAEPIWCPRDGYLQSFSLRVEKIRSGIKDNMGVTNIRFACSGGENLEGQGLSWGEYGVWSPRCLKGMCGIQTKQEMPRGGLRDDTALNDIRIFCCSH